jgi:hypothetical protein
MNDSEGQNRFNGPRVNYDREMQVENQTNFESRGTRGFRDRGSYRQNLNYNDRQNYYSQQSEKAREPDQNKRPDNILKAPIINGNLSPRPVNNYLKEINYKRKHVELAELIVKSVCEMGSWIILVIKDRNFLIIYDTILNKFTENQQYVNNEINDVIIDVKGGCFGDFNGTKFSALAYNKFNEVDLSLTFVNKLFSSGHTHGVPILELFADQYENFVRCSDRSIPYIAFLLVCFNIRRKFT